MVKRFPHILRFNLQSPTQGPYQDENGDWVNPTPETNLIEIPCRVQPNVRANYITNQIDGQKVEFSFVAFMETKEEPIPSGQNVEVLQGENLLYSGIVKRYHSGQLHDRIWV
jgi:hypothetical protein